MNPIMKNNLPDNNSEDIQELLTQVSKLGYRFTRPIQNRVSYSEEAPEGELIKAVILDTETTGLNSATDKIIELGMISFEFCPKTGKAYRVLGTFNELEDPGFPIPPESTKVHGIDDVMVSGKLIDDAKVISFLDGVRLIIAHNAKFDRPFVESRLPIFKDYAWACSLSQIPWSEEGISSAKQEFLAYSFGFHYEGHRASNDCQALLEILQQNFPKSGNLVMKRLIESLVSKEVIVSPLNSPYDSKDQLKARGYRWSAERKLWSKFISVDALYLEAEWLKTEVYSGRSFELEQEKIGPKTRFSNRRGKVEFVNY